MAATSLVSYSRLARPLLPLLRPQYLNKRRISDSGRNAKLDEVRSVPVRVAFELFQAGHRYLDVRTYDEFSAGHVSGAINIPYMFRSGADMSKNPMFLEEVSSHFGKDDELIVGCRSGKRSLMAAADLQSAGFTCVIDIAGGYSAWTESKFPTEK